MLDPALCVHQHSQWLAWKSMVATWLLTPTLVVLPLTALILLPWIIPRLPWKRQLSGLGTALLLMYYIATLPLTTAVAAKGLVTFVPSDPGVTADAIVVLGRGVRLRNSRVDVAAELWKENRAPLIFASGAGDGSQIVELLSVEGIPNQALNEESCSRTTQENALFTATVLKPQGVKQILLVTDPPHMLRSLLTFRSLGFTVIPHLSPLPPDLPQGRKAVMVLYEYVGLVSYGLKGRYFPQSLPIAERPIIATLENPSSFQPQVVTTP